jgi:hypothetical protein
MVLFQSGGNSREVRLGFGDAGRLLGMVNSAEDQGRQQGDDQHHDEQLDDGEGRVMRVGEEPGLSGSLLHV